MSEVNYSRVVDVVSKVDYATVIDCLNITTMPWVRTRSGKEVSFDPRRIGKAIEGANKECTPFTRITEEKIWKIVLNVTQSCYIYSYPIPVEDIQDMVEMQLMKTGAYRVAQNYIRYRYEHKLNREGRLDETMMSIVEGESAEAQDENSNKNVKVIPTQRDYLAGEVSKDVSRRRLFDKKLIDAHDQGIIHIHDLDYFIHHMHNCCLINLDDMLQNGTVISDVMIEKPHTFSTACTIATQIIAQVASCQYGGQSISLYHLSKFVDETRKYFRDRYEYLLDEMSDKNYNMLIELMVRNDIAKGIQTIQYQLITISTTNGQAPFVTLWMNLAEAPEGRERDDLAICIEEVLVQRIQGVKNKDGIAITPAFPKLIYALDECNIAKSSEYYWLTLLSAKCTAKRMVPDYISTKIMKELKGGEVYTCMGCRSFLTPCRFTENYANSKNYGVAFEPGHQYYGRFNQGVVTINLVDVACSSGKDEQKFFDILEDRLDNLCYPALMTRHKRLLGTKSDVAPILWQNGALARLKPGEPIDELLYHGYSTISLGIAGLAECVQFMVDGSITSKKGEEFGKMVMQVCNDRCAEWKKNTDIDFSVYGTPIEQTTYRFAKKLQKRFGKIPNVTDRNYITNSYHVPVWEHIDAFDKIALESEFQALTPGGAVSYIEMANMSQNLDAVVAVMQYMYDTILYAEMNTKSDYCHDCGYDGEIQIVEDEHGKLVWECPACKNRDQNRLSVARRTCGYIGTQFWNQGRTQEIKERFVHLGGDL